MAQAAARPGAGNQWPVVAIRDLHKSFGALEVLKGISFSTPARAKSSP
jgi:ABC-type histidine transport system ATPase subunit